MDLFEATQYARIAKDPKNTVRVSTDRTLAPLAGWTTYGADGSGTISSASIALHSFSSLRHPEGTALLMHELVHALGFGHTCAWPSVVAARTRCGGQARDRASAHDVAYAQMALAVHDAAARLGTSPWQPTLDAMGMSRAEPGGVGGPRSR